MKKIFSIILSFIFIFCVLATVPVMAASEKTYSNVLDDLEKDETFDASAYPDNPEDVSVKLIQIAESEDGQLFLYVYQPADSQIDLECVSVSISVGFSANGEGLDPKLYDLILVSTEGVFDKYLVNGFALPDEAERYYNIVSLYREFNSVVDPEGDKTEYKDTACKAYGVGQQWCAYTLNDRRVYEMNTFKTLEVEYTLIGALDLENGITWGNLAGFFEHCHSHLYAFNCDEYVIKKIFDADLHYTKEEINEYKSLGVNESTSLGKVSEVLTLTDKDVMSFEGNGILAKSYSWNRIMSATEYRKIVEENGAVIPEEYKTILENSQWVFSFAETPFSYVYYNDGYSKTYTEITDVSLLRLHFQDITGKTYDLGVVSDMGNSVGSIGGINGTDFEGWFNEMTELFEKLFAVVFIVLLLAGLAYIFPVLKGIFEGIVYILKFVWWMITLPFRLIMRLLSRK